MAASQSSRYLAKWTEYEVSPCQTYVGAKSRFWGNAMATTVEKGASFEDAIAALLSCKYENVQQAVRLYGKNADITFTCRVNPRRSLVIAVECKDWERGCTSDDVREIFLSYESAIDQHEIDELWIVTRKRSSASVRQYAAGKANLELFSVEEIERDIIDFSEYLEYLIEDCETDSLYSYYILPKIAEFGDDLHRYVTNWLEQDAKQPLAIWGGYGMGKTSYARFLAAFLARRHKENPAHPVPILVSLGEFHTSPNLPSLIRYLLDDRHHIKSFNQRAFDVLTRYRRLVLILDGFDEMKHAMSVSEFEEFSEQILELSNRNPQLILLGRPDAILSEEEYEIIAKNSVKLGSYAVRNERLTEFVNIRLAFFTQNEYVFFLRKYLSLSRGVELELGGYCIEIGIGRIGPCR